MSPLPPSPSQVIGSIDGSGRVKLVDKNAPPGTPPAVDLDLDKVREGGGEGGRDMTERSKGVPA